MPILVVPGDVDALKPLMPKSTTPSHVISTQARPSKASGLMVAAIAVHLLVSTMASAATTCSETIERTRVTRLSYCVAQAIRELVDHQAVEQEPGVLRASDAEPIASLVEPLDLIVDGSDCLAPWLLNLPPPLA